MIKGFGLGREKVQSFLTPAVTTKTLILCAERRLPRAWPETPGQCPAAARRAAPEGRDRLPPAAGDQHRLEAHGRGRPESLPQGPDQQSRHHCQGKFRIELKTICRAPVPFFGSFFLFTEIDLTVQNIIIKK